MSPKHLLLIPAVALLLYLGMYSWNQRTHILDEVAANTGLEASGVVLKSVRLVQDTVMGAWNRYMDLVDVREENDELKREVERLRHKLLMASEERAELIRLRRLLTLTPPEGWQTLGARVLAGRMGANAALASVLIGRGYLTGAIPGTPVMTPEGVAGRVLRAGPSSALAGRSRKPHRGDHAGEPGAGRPCGRRPGQAVGTAFRLAQRKRAAW